jgi:peroxidase
MGSQAAVLWFTAAVALGLLSGQFAAATGNGAAGLKDGFYKGKCGKYDVESIIYESMKASFKKNPGIAPGILRIVFHDCFVRGCDASLLLDGPNTEKFSPINLLLRGFDALDAAKAAVEDRCPGVVSCADIVQFTARDSVVLTGGKGWPVPGGRRDGTVSLIAEPLQQLPNPNQTVPELLPVFEAKGMNAAQMVALSGSHTIGIAHCQFIINRIWTFNSSTGADPRIPEDFLASLRKQCPSQTSTGPLDLDQVSGGKFDKQYFKNIIQQRGLLTSDQSMLDDSRTQGEVYKNNDKAFFDHAFADAMIAMSKIGVLTGNVGQIRTNCRKVNS